MGSEKVEIVRLEQLPLPDLQPLLKESQDQGFNFLEWLAREFEDGKNQFDNPGEALFAVYRGSQMIAIGGLNRDPYLRESNVGRVRRVYVLSSWRRKGIGRSLMQQIITEAKLHYRLLTLRTFDEPADEFYCALGFKKDPSVQGASHTMVLY